MSIPWSRAEIVDHLRHALDRVVHFPTFAHHLAKASVERWVAFELAAMLDHLLHEHAWIALVECGGVSNFDLLLVPITAVETRSRTCLKTHTWPTDAIAIVLKVAHLSDGDKGRSHALIEDLMKKPRIAKECGHPCSMFFGVVITTSGLGTTYQAPVVMRTKERASRMLDAKVADGLAVVGMVERAVGYGEGRAPSGPRSSRPRYRGIEDRDS